MQCWSCGSSGRICLSDEKYSKIVLKFPGSCCDILTRKRSYTEQATHSCFYLEMRLNLDRTIKASDVLTSLTILVSVVALLVSWTKDRDIRTREQADRVRTAAAKTIAKLERWEAIQLSLYSELQPTYVEVSEAMAKQFNVASSRDLLWKRINALRAKIASRVLDEAVETAYVDLFAYHPSIRGTFQEVMADLRTAEKEASLQLLAETERAILSFEGKQSGYQTAQLGNALRAVAHTVEVEFRKRIASRLTGIQDYLYRLLSLTDEQLLIRSGTRDSR